MSSSPRDGIAAAIPSPSRRGRRGAEHALPRVDEVEAPAPQLRRQRLRVAVHPEDRRPPLARASRQPGRRVDRGDDGAELGELGGASPVPQWRWRTRFLVRSPSVCRTIGGSSRARARRRCARRTARLFRRSAPSGAYAEREAAVDDQRLAAHHRGVAASRGTRRRRRCRRAPRAGRPACARPSASISSLFGNWSSAPVSTTPAETALTRIPRGASSTAR